ncbi:hypothetical protein [Streptomyces sp. BA2]|uniref:hypothetical protein n=1 Tax=Streptomyces sp. BA2 TaxID=436595 RepID=UPI0013296129|nr:hypothetical protein [Streptomyces sp. BA2]MWA07866.1 hypothetical protein [Streptomyces sp. BA2]
MTHTREGSSAPQRSTMARVNAQRTVSNPGDRGHSHVRIWARIAVLAPAAAILILGYGHRWAGDDSLIYTRAVRQILAGNGPVFNIGERAESSTGTLWQWLVVLGHLISGADPLLVAVVLGLITTTLGYALAGHAALRLHGSRQMPLPLGVLLVLPVSAFWDYASSGLETGLVLGWLALCWWLLVTTSRDAPPVRHAATAVGFGLGPLVRPDLGLVTVVFLAIWLVLLRTGILRAGGYLAAAAALPVSYEIFRAGYYGVLIPLPAVSKEASESLWGRGLFYAQNFLLPYKLWIPLLVLIALALTQLWRWRLPLPSTTLLRCAAPVLSGLLSMVYVVRVGGDFMHARMLLPGLFLMMLPVWFVPMNRRTAASAVTVGVWSLCCLLLWRPPFVSPRYEIYDQRRGYQGITGSAHPTTQADHLRNRTPFTGRVKRAAGPDGQRLVLEAKFNRSYLELPLADRFQASVAGSRVMLGHNGLAVPLDGLSIDPIGLSYPLAAHVERTGRFKAGADKRLSLPWIIADYTDPGARLPGWVDEKAVAAARRALSCGRLAELQNSVREPLSAGRFWKNLTGSVQRTTFRFPADPVAAEASACRD